MTFYLGQDSTHFDDFYPKVIDPTWLANSVDANATTLPALTDATRTAHLPSFTPHTQEIARFLAAYYGTCLARTCDPCPSCRTHRTPMAAEPAPRRPGVFMEGPPVPATSSPPAPRHLGVLPDGNRRWARRRRLPPCEGHRHGFRRIPRMLDWCEDSGLEFVTLFLLSDRNVRHRSAPELGVLYETVSEILPRLRTRPAWRLRHIGAAELLSDTLAAELHDAERDSRAGAGMTVNLALAYGGRADILAAVRGLVSEPGCSGPDLTEDAFGRRLSTGGQPDPDLIVRTSGEQRTSGFLTWQAAQAEWYFSPKMWPEFEREDLDAALAAYGQRERRLGA
ncbi:polyprenyl diphosphate synthase [Streptomyces sp. NPDC058171]